MSALGLGCDRIPEAIQKKANKIFSKHNPREVREWSNLLQKNLSLLHAVEKPINFDFVKPYASTTDLKNMLPNIDHELAAQKMENRIKEEKRDKEIGEEDSEVP